MDHRARLVIVGAGFAGASLVRNLPAALRRPGATLLIDRAERHPFIPLVHEVVSGRVHPESLLSPLEPLCRGRCGFLRAEVEGVDLERRTLHTSDGRSIGYETLVLTPGSVPAAPPGHLEGHVRTFWSLEDALWLRDELARRWEDARRGGAVPPSVAIVGGGATGVELAAEVASLFSHLRRLVGRKPDPLPKVHLIEGEHRLLGWLSPYFHSVAVEELQRMGVEVRLGHFVDEADPEGVRAGGEKIPAPVKIWTAGVEASPLVRALPGEHDGMGRMRVSGNLTLPHHPEVYVLGDSALCEAPNHGTLPPTASVAVQQGPYVARDLGRRQRRIKRPPFRFFDRGYVVGLGPGNAVAEALGVRLRGPAAQALYRSILLYYMRSREGRLLTLSDWTLDPVLGRLGFSSSSA